MIKIYLKSAWRSIKKYKGFFVLNFAGLYVSVVACLLIGLIILYETSFDKPAHDNLDVYRVVKTNHAPTGVNYGAVTPYPLARAMRAALPGEKFISQVHYQKDDVITFGDKKFKAENVLFADSVFPKLFSLMTLQGDVGRALAAPGFAVLTQSTANRFFGHASPIGERIRIGPATDLEVAAVIEDAPGNSHLPYTMIVSYASLTPAFIGNFPLDTWGLNASGYVYIGLRKQDTKRSVQATLRQIAAEHLNNKKDGNTTDLTLQPLQDVHYNQLYAASNPSYTINFSYLYLVGAIGLFLILAACINYTNLSTALAIKKSKEVGVRKTLGATKQHLIKQFLSETFFLTALVFVTAAVSVRFFLPALNNFLDKNIPLNWFTAGTVLMVVILWLLVSFISGLYPAFVLSSFNPIAALKNKVASPKRSVINLRRGLVVFQFLTAQVLIICAIVVAKQMNFIESQPLGFAKNNVIDINLQENKPEQLKLLKDKLSVIAGVSDVSFSLGAPVSDNNASTSFNLDEKFATEKMDVQVKAVDKEYLKTYGLRIAAGRWFDESDERGVAPDIPDSVKRYHLVLNETAVKTLGFSSPQAVLGKYIKFGFNDISAPVVGVVKDFNIESLHESVNPVLLVEFPFFYYNVGIKLENGYSASVLSAIEKAWTSVYPQSLFERNFLDEHIAALYKKEKRMQQLFSLFTFLSITINVLGLIGLLSFMIEQKTKEIGIRKVLGASVRSISMLLSKDFVQLIIISFFIAAPVAWLLMNKWLQDFAYRTTITWWVFGAAIILVLLVTIIAVSFQMLKAALANPVKSLRTE